MTLGEFRDKTRDLDDFTEITVVSSFDEDHSNRMDTSDIFTPDFYPDDFDDSSMPLIVLVFNEEKNL